MKKIYLDNNATTALDPRVVYSMEKILHSGPLNPSSIHYFGQTARQLLTTSRDTIAQFLKVSPKQLLFTASGTEALNFLIRGFYKKGSILSSNVEHPAVIETIKSLKAPATFLPAGLFGAITAEQIQKAIEKETNLIVLTAANNITGVKTDLESIAHIALEKKIPLIVDGIQILGKENFTIYPGIQGMAFSAHKLHGPTGAGLVFSKVDLTPQITGGKQESGRRGGTENLLSIVGFAKAIELLLTELPEASRNIKKLRDRLIIGLSTTVNNIVVHGDGPKICNTAHIGFPDIDGETLLLQLDLAGVAVSHGSACSSGGLEPSPILLNMGITRKLVQSSLRFSLSRFTTQEEIDETVAIISKYTSKKTTHIVI
jgi:cysteine desulfurase